MFNPEFGDTPNHTQRHQDAHERRQPGNGFENGNEQQTSDTDDKHRLAQVRMTFVQIGIPVSKTGDDLQSALLEEILCDKHWNHHRHNAGQKQIDNKADRRHFLVHPQHDSGDVTNGREGTTGIGRDNNHASEQPTIFLVAEEATQHHHHDDGGRHVVEHGRHDKRERTDNPQQVPLALGIDVLGDERKTAIAVNDLNNGHGTDKEHHNLASVTQLHDDCLMHFRIVAKESIDGP